MIYDFAIVVPAGTPAATPVRQDIKLDAGVIHKVEVEFYPGCARTVFVHIDQGGHQVWPTDPDGRFCSDGYTISFDEHLELTGEGDLLTVYAYAPTSTYPHTIVVRIGLIRAEDIESASPIIGGLQKLLALVGIKI